MKAFYLRFLLAASLIVPLSFNFVSAQNETENLLEKVDLHFNLGGDPSPADVGFDNPKSYWYLGYELYLTDSTELEKLGRCQRNEVKQLDCFMSYNKKLDKKIKKMSLFITKGKFKKNQLETETNRYITIPVELSPTVIEIYNQAAKIFEKNPTFVIFIKTKVSTKTATKRKFKKKLKTSRIFPLKTYAVENNGFDYWNVSGLLVGFAIRKGEDGKINGLEF